MAWPRLSRSASPGGSLLPLAHLPTVNAALSESTEQSRSRERSRSRARPGHTRSSSSVAKVSRIAYPGCNG